MKDPIEPLAVYTTEEACKILGLKDDATVQSLIRNGKIAAVQVGRTYRISGQAILDFVRTQPKSKQRSMLLAAFNDTVKNAYPIIKAKNGGSMAVLLHQAININADEGTLRRLIDDLNRFIKNHNEDYTPTTVQRIYEQQVKKYNEYRLHDITHGMQGEDMLEGESRPIDALDDSWFDPSGIWNE